MNAAAQKNDGYFDYRDSFAATIEALAEADPRIVTVVSDSVGSSKLGGFRTKFPDRMINVGIAEQTLVAVGAGLANNGPVFVRVSRMAVPALERPEGATFEMGKAEKLVEGADATIIANGTMVHRAVAAARSLADEGIAARVVNMATVNPLDEAAIASATDTGAIVTVEEHSVRGALGGAIAEVVATTNPVPMRILGFPGFVPTGSAKWLFDHYDLSAAGIADAVRLTIARKT